MWFLNGKSFYDFKYGEDCEVDGTHPNNLGFYRMAEKLLKKLKEINSDIFVE